MKLCIYEDDMYKNFLPLSWTRPVYFLRCGIRSLSDKIEDSFPDLKPAYLCRDYLKDTVIEETDAPVNEFDDDNYLFINGRAVFGKEIALQIPQDRENVIFCSDDREIGAILTPENVKVVKKNAGSSLDFRKLLPDLSVEPIEAEYVEYPWDLLNKNGQEIKRDFEELLSETGSTVGTTLYQDHHGTFQVVNGKNVSIADSAIIKPGVVLDAENGPILISPGAEILANAVIEGPVFIGENSVIKAGARIYGSTSIGESCKVGGEVSTSIIHSFSNKQHDGFLGNSYLGKWVNLGADTNTSNLKNNYKNVTVTIEGKPVDTGTLFLGTIMGDHSRTGINTMLNTGTSVGFCCNIFGGEFPPKYIPSFSWGGSKGLTEYRFEKAMETAQHVVSRRKKKLSLAFERLSEYIFAATAEERAGYSR